jgi:hypothetical protein
LVGTDAEDSNITKKFSIGDLKAFISSGSTLPYTSLVQLMNQTGAAAPVATEVYNNTGETYIWSYVSEGIYRLTSTGTPFIANKTIVFANIGDPGGVNPTQYLDVDVQYSRISSSVIQIKSSGNSLFDGLITNGSFEIKIYN